MMVCLIVRMCCQENALSHAYLKIVEMGIGGNSPVFIAKVRGKEGFVVEGSEWL